MSGTDSDKQWLELEKIWKQLPVNTEVPAAILKWVRRQERRMRLVVAFEWLVVLGVGIYVVVAILNKDQSDVILRLAFALSMLALAVGFSMTNRRGLWAPLEESAKAYVDLGLLRLKRKRREVHFSWFFLFLQIFLIGIWSYARAYSGSTEPLIRHPQEVLIVFSGFVVSLILYSVYIYRRTGREKMVLKSFQKKYLK
ncbi:hypothetical protein ACJJJB_18140 [Microbulbifer sp. ANSA001]|uniref:hypothetical protein n=1 Tax=Microbulbifer sp. ANSA001 TaxID=3243358 RepID=UPI004042D831